MYAQPVRACILICSEEKDLVYKDAVYFSPHKFVGGVDSPGKPFKASSYKSITNLIYILCLVACSLNLFHL